MSLVWIRSKADLTYLRISRNEIVRIVVRLNFVEVIGVWVMQAGKHQVPERLADLHMHAPLHMRCYISCHALKVPKVNKNRLLLHSRKRMKPQA